MKDPRDILDAIKERKNERREWGNWIDDGPVLSYEECLKLITQYRDDILKEAADRYCDGKCAWPSGEWKRPDECECAMRKFILTGKNNS